MASSLYKRKCFRAFEENEYGIQDGVETLDFSTEKNQERGVLIQAGDEYKLMTRQTDVLEMRVRIKAIIICLIDWPSSSIIRPTTRFRFSRLLPES